jgi:hypothetical protein
MFSANLILIFNTCKAKDAVNPYEIRIDFQEGSKCSALSYNWKGLRKASEKLLRKVT